LDDDVELKLIFTSGMVIIYAVPFLTQKLETAMVSTLISGFTNALIGFFAYNWMKRKTTRNSKKRSVKDNVTVKDTVKVE